jgi:hypothetical protein
MDDHDNTLPTTDNTTPARPDLASLTQPADVDDYDLLRDVDLDGFRLQIMDENSTKNGKAQIRAILFDQEGRMLFEEIIGCSPLHSVDSDAAVRSAIGFLTLRPGDTDPEYFDDYTRRQLAWADEHGEQLSIYAWEDEDAPALRDWSERTHEL